MSWGRRKSKCCNCHKRIKQQRDGVWVHNDGAMFCSVPNSCIPTIAQAVPPGSLFVTEERRANAAE